MLSDALLLQNAKTLLVKVQASAAKHCFACMSQVWDMSKPSKSELCENTKLPFMALESPLNSTFCFGSGAPNNEVGQLKSQHCFHSATVYFYYSLQYPLSYLVLTTLVSPTLSPRRFAPSSYLPSFLSLCDMQHQPQKKNETVKLGGSIHSL